MAIYGSSPGGVDCKRDPLGPGLVDNLQMLGGRGYVKMVDGYGSWSAKWIK